MQKLLKMAKPGGAEGDNFGSENFHNENTRRKCAFDVQFQRTLHICSTALPIITVQLSGSWSYEQTNTLDDRLEPEDTHVEPVGVGGGRVAHRAVDDAVHQRRSLKRGPHHQDTDEVPVIIG